jgi:hypothetical protein
VRERERVHMREEEGRGQLQQQQAPAEHAVSAATVPVCTTCTTWMCSRCDRELPATHFSPSCAKNRVYRCKACRAAYRCERRARVLSARPEAERQLEGIAAFLRRLRLRGEPVASPPPLETVRRLLVEADRDGSPEEDRLLRPRDPSRALDGANCVLLRASEFGRMEALRTGRWPGWRRVAEEGKRPDRRSLRRRTQLQQGVSSRELPRIALALPVCPAAGAEAGSWLRWCESEPLKVRRSEGAAAAAATAVAA